MSLSRGDLREVCGVWCGVVSWVRCLVFVRHLRVRVGSAHVRAICCAARGVLIARKGVWPACVCCLRVCALPVFGLFVCGGGWFACGGGVVVDRLCACG